MALRTDFQDDVFSGNRKYRMIQNGDNTVSFEDVTSYSVVGDSYGANEINTLNQIVNDLGASGDGLVVSASPIPVADRKPGTTYFFR